MSTKRRFGLVALGLFAVCGTVSLAAGAEKTVNEKVRDVYHVVKAEVMQVGDVPGHVVGIFDASGLGFNMDTGEVCNYSGKVFFDLTNGTGPHQGYATNTCEGGKSFAQVKGVTTAHPDGTSTVEGTFVYTGGTGQLSGIKGGGSYRDRPGLC